jgi:phosphoribosylformimino-5-aminoimidazole carboxamide ribotide isomerase
MKFRPCIDIHNGKVKQIVGGSLTGNGERATESFVSEYDAAYFARFYAADELRGGHIIMLNPVSSPQYRATKKQALQALSEAPGYFQLGGGVTPYNAEEFLDAGASQVIVTSYVFQDGAFNRRHLEKMVSAVGRDRLVLDLSCRKLGDDYYIVTDRWQKFTDTELDEALFDRLSGYADEFLIHGIDVEGKGHGADRELVELLAGVKDYPITYAGGLRSIEDLQELRLIGRNKIHATVGSALDIYGGNLPYRDVVEFCRE